MLVEDNEGTDERRRTKRTNIVVWLVVAVLSIGFGAITTSDYPMSYPCEITGNLTRNCYEHDAKIMLEIFTTVIGPGIPQSTAFARCGAVINCATSPCDRDLAKKTGWLCLEYRPGVYMLVDSRWEAIISRIILCVGGLPGLVTIVMIGKYIWEEHWHRGYAPLADIDTELGKL